MSAAGAREHCPVCDRSAPPGKHPCRFEKACACWYGEPCQPAGADYRATVRLRTPLDSGRKETEP